MIARHVWSLLLLGVAGCAGSAAAGDAARAARQLEELRRQTDGDRHALHELENRVFVLEDKLDTAEVARGRTTDAAPRLPVVARKPPAPPAPPPPPPVPRSEPIVIDDTPPAEEPPPPDEDVDDGRPSVVIRMDAAHGSAGSGSVERVATAPPPRPTGPPIDLASVNERLPVVPLAKHPVPTATTTAVPAPPSSTSDEPMTAYQTAYQALGRREHTVAIAGFRAFIARWPGHDYADNAQYWLGEAYYDQADYHTALAEFRAVLKRYPGGNKVPDALLKIGFCMTKLGDASGATDVLSQVVQIYPKTDAARLAAQRLSELNGRQIR